ncbi:MAG: undecaprenyl/decaprenyl-phosphate alpha-N-acetylglucosaminyl 1-phosphate transferase [Phaeodactylibacter sp.]|nr:undecaprenyl/decaprenyl-phosphate alpha-N-acetylglucosaminyl 1-phosphate transferase [Phaeodactylibacter sp.]MCB9275062.1 undecaprenyl/decaprenyl-phosphate alpha-N-acetylglucosaminyl 1-phosphate transferase [Lewinellaceae bacterium]
MFVLVLSFLTAFTLTYFAIPNIIGIAREKNLFVEPGERSSHTISTPSLGGVGIFAGTIFSIVMWTPFDRFGGLQYILCAFLIVFLVGLKDDMSPVSPINKLIGQVLAASILVFKSDIHLRGFYGMFGLHTELPEPFYAGLTLFTILVIINSFNLIDGINGLAGSVGALISGVLGCWFFWIGRMELSIVAFSLVGAIIAFLKYNYTPAKIFMGDSGALVIGTACSILIIQFIDMNYYLEPGNLHQIQDVPAVAIGIMIIPLYDTLRVFITRILRGQSPLHADRRHIHHLLIDYGFTHMQATGILVAVNVFFILLAFSLNQTVELHFLLFLILGLATTLTYILHKSVNHKKRQKLAIR